MAVRVRTVRDLEEYRAAVGQIGRYFAWEPDDDDLRQLQVLLPVGRLHAAFDGPQVVGSAGVYPFELTIPGGPVSCACVTVVATAATHRRRGIAARLMAAQLRDVRERGEPIAALWASQETIYSRFGYGMASLTHLLRAPAHTAEIGEWAPSAGARGRFIDADEAATVLPRLYERIRKRTVGFLGRSSDWWKWQVLDDSEGARRGSGPLQRVLFEVGGRAVGYALYRVKTERTGTAWSKTLQVKDAFGVDDAATADVWRYLFSIDWMDTIELWMLPADHPLQLIATRVNELKLTVWDGLWVRVVDVPAALGARSYAGDGKVSVEITSDPHFPENVGTWTIEPEAGVRRTTRRPDVRVSVQSLGAAFLGGFSFLQLAGAGLALEGSRGGLTRADALFRTPAAPWCPENF